MLDIATTAVGAIGFVLLLGAFGLQLIGRLDHRALRYSVANLLGAGSLAWYASVKDALIFVILEAIWAMVAAITLSRTLWRRYSPDGSVSARGDGMIQGEPPTSDDRRRVL